MKNKVLDFALVLAFLIVLAMVIGAGWYLYKQFDSWGIGFGSNSWEEVDQEAVGKEAFEGDIYSFSIRSVAGAIEIEAWDGESLLVEYLKKGASREALDRINVRMEQNGSSVKVWTEFPQNSVGNNGWVEYRIKIPEGLSNLDVKSVSGSLRIGEESDSPVFDAIDQNLETVSGSVSTAGADDLEINSVSGSLDFTARGMVEAGTVSGRISAVIDGVKANQSIKLESISGSLRLDLPDDWGGEVRMNSISGSLKSSLPVIMEKQSRNSLEGRLGEGNGRLRLKTTSGSISIE